MPSTIVVAAYGDDQPSRDAVAFARRLAALGDDQARLVLAGVHVTYPLGDDTYDRAMSGRLERDLRAMADDLALDATVEAVWASSVATGLHDVAERADAALLVLGSSRHGHLGRLLHGDPALAVLQHAPCPVAVVPLGYADHADGRLPRVALAWDASEEAKAALEEAVALAEACGATLRVVRTVEAPVVYREAQWSDPTITQDWVELVTTQARASLDAATDLVDGRVPCVAEVLDGRAGERLAALSAEVDVLVCGSRGHGALARVALGSTSAHLLHHAACPVVVVPRPVAVTATTAG